ncbi:MAG TPA: hypothetical protein VFS21_31560 [Roseiflexaceae bacterium]|nr:hypothetical protein [Roseiflexaceae bacterium]
MPVIGPETSEDRELREWFATQKRGNIERLEAGAQAVIQLVTGLYGVLFAVLALGDQPAYLQQATVRWAGAIGAALLFGALLAAMLVVVPRRLSPQRDNLSEMEREYQRLQQRKARMLGLAQLCFVLGIACLVAVIVAILWAL